MTPAAPVKISHRYFPAFDVFRGIGILFVVAAHSPIQSPWLDAIRPIGALGVHMFFALSGFLITYRLLEEHCQTGTISLRGFYYRRARRILPPALIYLATLALLGPVLHLLPTSVDELAASLFFSRNLYRPPMPGAWYTAHFWSLSLEEQFYLFWPLLLVAIGASRVRLRWVALGLIGAAIAWRATVQAHDPTANIYRPDLLADHLLWGCLLGLIWDTPWRQALPGLVKTSMGLAAVALATGLIYLQPPFWQAPFALCVALGFIFAAESATRWTARWTWFQTLGKASYDCYLWQSLFLPLPLADSLLAWPQSVPWSYLCIAAVTALSFRLTFPRRRPHPKKKAAQINSAA